MQPFRLTHDDPALPGILALVRRSFAYMDGRIDPPSSMHRLTLADIAAHARDHEIWAIGAPPLACAFFKRRDGCLYIGKLAVCADHRNRGLARALIDRAETRARALGLKWLELETRIELVENHRAFARLGFARTGTTAHPGYDRPTSVTMRRPVGPA